MTDKPTPTDAELNTILCAHWPAFATQSTLVKIWVRDALQDAIDKWGQPAQAQADSVLAVSDLPPLPAPDLRDVGTKPQEIKEFLKGYATEYARTAIAACAPADSVPAVEREQERIAFKDAHRRLGLDEVPDAWGRPMFKHSHVEASWLGWIARASHGQAPAKTGNSVSAQAESVWRDADRIEKWSDRVQRAHPKSEPEFWPDALRVKYMADEISDLRAARAPAHGVQEDADRLDFLIEQRAYVVSDPDACPGHWLRWARPDGSTWVQVDEHPTPRAAIDAARKQGARWQYAGQALTLHI